MLSMRLTISTAADESGSMLLACKYPMRSLANWACWEGWSTAYSQNPHKITNKAMTHQSLTNLAARSGVRANQATEGIKHHKAVDCQNP